MQSQATVPHDMICKDKFLVQSTVVPDGTTDEAVDNSTVSYYGVCSPLIQ